MKTKAVKVIKRMSSNLFNDSFRQIAKILLIDVLCSFPPTAGLIASPFSSVSPQIYNKCFLSRGNKQ